MRALAVVGAATGLGLAWAGPLPAAARSSFAAHMWLHMVVVAVVPPLVVLGLAGTRVDPVARAPWLFPSLVASLVDLVVVWLWHTPAWHHAAQVNSAALVAEQLSFLAVGLWLWWSVLGGAPAVRLGRSGQALLALLLTFAHMTLLGALLALAPRTLYHHAGGSLVTTALADQQNGGVIMLVVGGAAYVGGGLWLAYGLLRGSIGEAAGS